MSDTMAPKTPADYALETAIDELTNSLFYGGHERRSHLRVRVAAFASALLASAAEEARRWFPVKPSESYVAHAVVDQLREAFRDGARWQSSQPPSDAEVEAALKVWFSPTIAKGFRGYDKDDREVMRAALEAAAEVRRKA